MMNAITSTPDISASIIPPTTTLLARYILTQVDQCTLVFPAAWVTEIVRIERSQVLELPFYDPLLLGIVHQNGGIVPLVSTHRLLQQEQATLRETFMIVRLSSATGRLANLGLVIDRALGMSSQTELPPALFESSPAIMPGTTDMVLINPEWMPPTLWQPQRWIPSVIT
jgi:chemotaxis signal transduction protein